MSPLHDAWCCWAVTVPLAIPLLSETRQAHSLFSCKIARKCTCTMTIDWLHAFKFCSEPRNQKQQGIHSFVPPSLFPPVNRQRGSRVLAVLSMRRECACRISHLPIHIVSVYDVKKVSVSHRVSTLTYFFRPCLRPESFLPILIHCPEGGCPAV